MTNSVEIVRGVVNRGTNSKGVHSDAGNPGTYLRNEMIDGVVYARYRAESGTWISASLKEQSYDQRFGKDTAYGAYKGVVRMPDGTALETPDKIRPGQEYLVPVLSQDQASRIAANPSPSKSRAVPQQPIEQDTKDLLNRYPFVPPFKRRNAPPTSPSPFFDSSWVQDKSGIKSFILTAWSLLRASPKVRDWFKEKWAVDPFESQINMSYTGRFGTDPFDAFALLHPNGITAYTNRFTGAITFTPRFKGRQAAREITATLMHELNNWAAWKSGQAFSDDYSPKGSYTAETLAYEAYDAAHPK